MEKRQIVTGIASHVNLPFRLSPSNRASGRNATNDFVSDFPEVSDLSASFPDAESWEPRRIFCSAETVAGFNREPLHFYGVGRSRNSYSASFFVAMTFLPR